MARDDAPVPTHLTQPQVSLLGRVIEGHCVRRVYVESRVDSLHLDYPRIIEVHAILDVQKYRQICEIILHCANHISIEATEETQDMYSAIDGAIAKVVFDISGTPYVDVERELARAFSKD